MAEGGALERGVLVEAGQGSMRGRSSPAPLRAGGGFPQLSPLESRVVFFFLMSIGLNHGLGFLLLLVQLFFLVNLC